MSSEVEREVFATPAELAEAAADRVAAVLDAALAHNALVHFALAGGSTPRVLYGLLGSAARRDRVPWERVELWFGDERCVAPFDVASNYRMAHEELLGPLDYDGARVHRIRGELGADAAAREYEQELRDHLGDRPRFDLVLLGLGGDGHTASLFPQSPALDETERLAVPAEAPVEPTERVTLTLPVLNASRCVFFVVAGSDKAPAVARVATRDRTAPAACVEPHDGRCTWLLDRAAATGLA